MIDEAHVRREKLEQLQKRGINPFPQDAEEGAKIGDLLASFDEWTEEQRETRICGRILTIRVHGGMIFGDVQDVTGKIQIVLKLDEIGEESFNLFRDTLDPGDFVEFVGVPITTKRGERSLMGSAWRPLAKALLPLPEKWHGLKDVEARYRQRELDLIANPEVREHFIQRSKLVSSLRHFLDDRGFLEVETPMLHPIPGGANAKPFITHHNALNTDFYLRIAPELYLKRLLVGGFERIYEVARCFRNEGIDFAHNPEFTQIELYWAYAGKERFMVFLEEMLTTIIQNAFGTLEIQHEKGTLNFTGPFPRITFREAVLEASGIDVDKMQSPKDVIEAIKKANISIDFKSCVGLDEYLDELYKKTARQAMVGPVWVMDYPIQMMPLANSSLDDDTKSATAQLIIHGTEVVKAFYYELNNPIEQRARFEEQQKLADKGSEVAQRMDESFLTALEHGMPPAAGMGMGIDRLCALLTGSHNLKEVILFPTLRPENQE